MKVTVRKRDFNVVVKVNGTKSFTFHGKKCMTKDKSFATRIGIKEVNETIDCESVKTK